MKESEWQIVRRFLICLWWVDAFFPGETKRNGRRAENESETKWFCFSSHLLGISFSFSLISGLRDRSIVIWNPLETDEAKQKRFLPQKHSNDVYSLSFSPDGRFLASGNELGGIIIWSTEVRNWVKRCVTGRVWCVFVNLQAATVYRIDVHLFHHSLHFSFFSLPFLDLDASFHRLKW